MAEETTKTEQAIRSSRITELQANEEQIAMNLEKRIDKLEKRNAWLIGILFMLLAYLVFKNTTEATALGRHPPSEIRARKIAIVDEKGNERIVMSADSKEGAFVYMLTDDAKKTGMWSATPSGWGKIELKDPNEKYSARLVLHPDIGPKLVLEEKEKTYLDLTYEIGFGPVMIIGDKRQRHTGASVGFTGPDLIGFRFSRQDGELIGGMIEGEVNQKREAFLKAASNGRAIMGADSVGNSRLTLYGSNDKKILELPHE